MWGHLHLGRLSEDLSWAPPNNTDVSPNNASKDCSCNSSSSEMYPLVPETHYRTLSVYPRHIVIDVAFYNWGDWPRAGKEGGGGRRVYKGPEWLVNRPLHTPTPKCLPRVQMGLVSFNLLKYLFIFIFIFQVLNEAKALFLFLWYFIDRLSTWFVPHCFFIFLLFFIQLLFSFLFFFNKAFYFKWIYLIKFYVFLRVSHCLLLMCLKFLKQIIEERWVWQSNRKNIIFIYNF